MTTERIANKYWALLAIGAFIRLTLCWVNPAANAFDDHFEPVQLIVEKGALPGKLDCWQCYQPPVFYVAGACVAKLLFMLGVGVASVMKCLQLLNCLYGIVTLWFVLLILRLLPLSDFSRFLAFGMTCFLPRHIYMCAMHSNDTLSYLLVAVCLWFLVMIISGRDSFHNLAALGLSICAALFTKYTTFSIIPVVGLSMALLPLRDKPLRAAVRDGIGVLFLPMLLLGIFMIDNKLRYGAALPYNVAIFDPAHIQPRDPGGAEFTSFAPARFVKRPILWPGQVSSFWTLLYSSMWFDTEPKFLPLFKHGDLAWWITYFQWLKGETPAPPAFKTTTPFVAATGSTLIALGLVPLVFVITGLVRLVHTVKDSLATRRWDDTLSLQPFVVLLLLNLAGIVQLTIRLPVFCAMKGSYLLPSLPSLGVLLALGIMTWESHRTFRFVCGGFFAMLFMTVIASTLAMVINLA